MPDRPDHGDPYWPVQLTLGVAVALNLVLTERVSLGPSWLVPGLGGALLVALVVVAPARATARARLVRRFALSVIGLISLAHAISLGLLVDHLVNGGPADGHRLVLSGAALWGTNVLLFALWYWEMDRGGPARRFRHPGALPDFLFPQMESPQFVPAGWTPRYGDYLYLSLTNATAFSPTDTMPLTHAAKLMMSLQSVSALLTVALVLARAVNILG